MRPRASVTTQATPPHLTPGEERPERALGVVHSPDPGVVGRAVPLGDDLLVVGRDVEGSGLLIEDGQLSRVHFRVAFDGRANSHRVGDARSRNGTFVDGTRVDSATLRPGSVVRAGETVFVYGNPSPMSSVRHRVERVAPSDLSVLILGETGTGKERLARAVHDLSGRRGPFVAVNCAALPRDLLGAELFGHTRGAFSGATEARRGLFASADGGTLFLDEIGDFPLALQPVLLRALEEGAVRPVGADAEVRVDVRIVAATHPGLEESVRDERFRADLYARLAHAIVHVPPLRARRFELLPLAQEIALAAKGHDFTVSADAAEALMRHDWPFNVRELEAVVRGFLAMRTGAPLGLGYLREHHPELGRSFRDGSSSPAGAPRDAASHGDRAALEASLSRHAGNVSKVAEELGKPRAQVYRRLKSLGLDPDRFR